MNQVENKLTFFIPVESPARELDYKLNLARHFCKEGFDVIIGHPPFIRDELKYKNYQGVFLEKGANPTPDYYANIAKKGVELFCLSDEGAAHPAYSVTYKPSVDALKEMKRIFLWGDFQKHDLIKRNDDNDLNNKYHTLGYPGLDLSLPKYKVYHQGLKPKKLPNDYILVNTNFGCCNGFGIKEELEACPTISPESKEMIVKGHQTEKKQFDKFYEWLRVLVDKFQDETFLIRPHPTEDKAVYEKLFSDCKNVVVSKDGNANQVISCAKLVLHHDCTTALQSYLMGVPVISLSYPNIDTLHASWALDFSACPQTVQELQDLVQDVLDHNGFTKKMTDAIHQKALKRTGEMFHDIGHASNNLVSNITRDMKDVIKKFRPYSLKDSRTLIMKLKLFLRKKLPLHYKTSRLTQATLTTVYKKDIERRLSLMDKMDAIGIKFNIKGIYPNTFLIEKK